VSRFRSSYPRAPRDRTNFGIGTLDWYEFAERFLFFDAFEGLYRFRDAVIATDQIDFVLRHDPTGPFCGLSDGS
jgi:hypothetical protein